MKSRRLHAQESLALELLARGLTQRRVAAALGASQGWVSLVCRRHGGGRSRDAARQRQARIVELRGRGLTYTAIAAAVGCRQAWVYKVLKRHAATRPASGGGVMQVYPGAEYLEDEARYLAECERYRSAKGKKFLTACDYLAVMRSLLATKKGV